MNDHEPQPLRGCSIGVTKCQGTLDKRTNVEQWKVQLVLITHSNDVQVQNIIFTNTL